MQTSRQLFILFILALVAFCGVRSAQAQEKYDVRSSKFYVYDKSGHPWNDANCYLGVRLDAAKRDTLEDQEVSAGTVSYAAGGDYQRFALKFDASGSCFAEVSFVIYKASDKAINYEITLLRKEGDKYVAVPLTSRAIAVTRSSPDRIPINVSVFRPMLMNDWLFYGGIMLACLLFIYFVIFRWLFSVLLFNNNWPVSRAEYFTTSLSLLLLVGVFGLLIVLFLPQTVVMWTILSIMTLMWVGHAITWALS